jgi:hypothetical protein
MYSTNTEYRSVLRAYFKMDLSALEQQHSYLKDEDPESYDEMLYDDDAMKRGMDEILERTRENPLFTDLYTLAAGRFLTDDRETGLCVLLSYDYFLDFINVYECPDLSESSECYLTLKRKLS